MTGIESVEKATSSELGENEDRVVFVLKPRGKMLV